MKLSGLWPSLLTPMTADGAVDHTALAASVTDLVGRGVDGLVPLGTIGEFTEFSPTERREVLDTVIGAAAGRVPVLAGVSGLSTRETCAHARDAAAAGADAVIVLPPLYPKVPEARMFDHFRAVADATDRPVVLYDFPAQTATPLPASLLERVAAEEPRVIGAKLTVRDVRALATAIAATRRHRPDFAVVTGFEDLVPAALWLGADGAISGLACLVPDLMLSLCGAVRSGDPELPDLLRRVTAMFDVYELTAPSVPGVKAAAHALGRLPSPTSRVNAGPLEEIVAAAAEWVRRHDPTAEEVGSAPTAAAS